MKFAQIMYLTIFSLLVFTGCMEDELQNEESANALKKKNSIHKNSISINQKKQNFKDTLVPIAIKVYTELESRYQTIKLDIHMDRNRQLIEELKKEYNAKTDELLLHSLKPHPISILLAQAAAESAWLTSRFTKEANNIFGVWSFNKKEARIAASGLRGDKTIYLKKYKTLEDAVRDYYKNLGKNWAYKDFRKNRTLTSNPYVLSDYLRSYSEKKDVYTKLLKSMISYNKFEQYDIKSDLEYDTKIKMKQISSTDKNIKHLKNNQMILKESDILKDDIPKPEVNKIILKDINNIFLKDDQTMINEILKFKGLNK